MSGEQRLRDACLQALGELPDLTPQLAADGERLFIKGKWGGTEYRLRLLPRLSPESLELVRQQQGREALPLLLLCTHVGPRQAAELRRQGLQFVDAGGNAWLSAPPLYLEISGRRRSGGPPRPARAFTSAGLKLIYLLLRDPVSAGSADYRTLALDAGIALGAIGGILKELAAQQHLQPQGRRRLLLRPEALLLRWQLGYLEQLRPRLLLQTCRPAAGQALDQLPQAIRSLGLEGKLLLGGELGAALLTGTREANWLSLHLDEADALRLMLQLRLTPDPAGKVTLLRRFGRRDRWRGWQPDTAPLADPLLLAGELAATGQAGSPLAERLRQDYLLPRLTEPMSR